MTSEEVKERYPEAYESGWKKGYSSGYKKGRHNEGAYLAGVRAKIRCFYNQGAEDQESYIARGLLKTGFLTVDEIATILELDPETVIERAKKEM